MTNLKQNISNGNNGTDNNNASNNNASNNNSAHNVKPVRVVVTGAAGQIGYSLLFRIASGELLGSDQPIILQLLDITAAMNALKGVVMELDDCAFPLLRDIIISDDPNIAFKDANIIFLVGSRPRSKGMERKDLLEANANIFITQGRALANSAHPDAKVLVVGNPANTNALIAIKTASGFKATNITAMLRLDHNRSLALLSKKLNCAVNDLAKVCVWGNHSLTQYPDVSHALVRHLSKGDYKEVLPLITQEWLVNEFIPTVQKRGGAVIEARGLSSAASAANAAIDHMRSWIFGTKENQWVSMGVLSTGNAYGVPQDLVFGFPVQCRNGNYEIVSGLELNEFSKTRIQESVNELLQERQAIEHLLAVSR